MARRAGLLRVSLAGMLVMAAAGCSGDPEAPAAADCSSQVRLDGQVYTSYGYTDRAASRFAQVELADCDDLRQNASGSVFPDDPHLVSAWSFPGYSTDTVIGVRFGADSFAVHVSDAVPRAEATRLFAELAEESGSISDRELALAQDAVQQEAKDEALVEATLESASVTVGPGRVRLSNTGHRCDSGRLLRIRLIGTFPRIATGGGLYGDSTDDNGVVRAVLLTADAVSGDVCLIGVMTGHPEPRPGARALSIH